MKFKQIMIGLTVTALLFTVTACSSPSKNETTEATTSSVTPTEATTSSIELSFDAEAMTTSFVGDLMKENYEALAANYPYIDEMKEKFTVQVMTDIRTDILKNYGDFEGTTGYDVQDTGTYFITTVGGMHTQKDLAYKLAFTPDGKIAGFTFQEITSVEDFFSAGIPGAKEVEVTFGDPEYLIEGTLSIPDTGKDSYPAVVLVHGSGPNDRDETIHGNKPFKDIAAGLIEKGIAVLRYDKRTFTHKAKFADENTALDYTIYQETIDDAKYAVDFLANYEGIDAGNIFVAGHSLGGNQAPRIAQDNDQVAGLIILAGNVTPLQNLVVKQYEYLLNLDGQITESEKMQIQGVVDQAKFVMSSDLTRESDLNLTLGLPGLYWMDIRDYDPTVVAKTLEIPMLIMQGERDYQVTKEELGLWQAGLGDKAEYKSYPNLNHLFITGEGMSVPEEYQTSGKVDETAISDMADFIMNNLK